MCTPSFSLRGFHTRCVLHISCSHRPSAAELSRQTSVFADPRESLVTLLFLLTFCSPIISVFLHIICWFIPLIPSNCSPFLPFFCSYIPRLACKWLKNVSGISAMDLPIQRNVKIKNSVPTYVTPHTCYHHLLYAGVHIWFCFPSLLHLHFLHPHPHPYTSVFLSPINSKI